MPPPCFPALRASIEAGNVDSLQENLLQALDEPIKYAFFAAARKGLVDAIPILWERLSPSGKQQFLDDKDKGFLSGYLPPLHEAVYYGHLHMVEVLVQPPYHFHVNQMDRHGNTPLLWAVKHLEITNFLLKNGADVNRGKYSPLSKSVRNKNVNVARLLLMYGADPNLNQRRRARPAAAAMMEEEQHGNDNNDSSPSGDNDDCCTDLAIKNGDSVMLSMLLQHGALVTTTDDNYTPLYELLNDCLQSRETKVAISQMLVHHAKTDCDDTLLVLQSSLESAIEESCDEDDDDNMLILLEAGVVPHSRTFCIAIREQNLSLCQLLVHHGGNPFLQDDTRDSQENDDDHDADAAASPFVAAARLKDILIFAYFLDLWYDDRHFSASQGKNNINRGDDDPLHVICRDPQVSLQAITLVVAHDIDAVTRISSQEGLFPFQISAVTNSHLNIIFYLLKRRPDALRQFRLLAAGVEPVPMTGSKKGRKRKKQEQEENQVERTISSH